MKQTYHTDTTLITPSENIRQEIQSQKCKRRAADEPEMEISAFGTVFYLCPILLGHFALDVVQIHKFDCSYQKYITKTSHKH